ncbi:MAG: ABC transporter permease [Selenomonadaceae bacterium]|nr:ABC transporter permease [Selenomonadaceae bacterium]
MLIRFLEIIGGFIIRRCEDFGKIVLVYVDTIKQLRHKPRFKHIIAQMAHLGADSLLIVSSTLLFTGIVFTLQTAHEFIRFGAESTVGGVVSIAIGRELGPVLVGVVCAGRVGAAITAEISTMKVTEQIDALKVMAVSPVDYLIVPRMLACMIVVPILTIFGDVIGVFGGYLVAVNYSGISQHVFIQSIREFAVTLDLTGGLIKASFFGNVIAVLGCYYGLHCSDGAEGVGIATTKTVVSSIIVIFILNAILTFIIW